MRELLVLHLQRSGGHGFVQWILNQCSAKMAFVNDVCHPDKVGVWSHTPPIIPECEWLAYNVEDRLPGELKPLLLEAGRFLPIMCDVNPIYVLLIRDVYNMLASRWKFWKNGNSCLLGTCGSSVVDAWVQHARLAFLLQHGCGARLMLEKMLVVNYNRWALDPIYRQALWNSLSMRDDGIPGDFREDAHLEVPAYGCGSSFDGVGQLADSMDVCKRYEHVPPEVFVAVTEEAAFWNQAIFGWRL